jgi:hypothetical protein
MKCPKCRTEYGTLICPVCVAQSARNAYLRQQELYVPKVFDGAPLNLSRRSRSQPAHIVLFGDTHHAYCGVALDAPQVRERCEYTSELRARLCPDCLAIFDEVAERVAARLEAE